MKQALEINNMSLILSTFLLAIAVAVSYKEDLDLEKDIIIAGVRATIQLFIIGFILKYVFGVSHVFLTIIMVLFMTINAGYHAHKKSDHIPNSLSISLISILTGTFITLAILILTGAIDFVPTQIIPITGMVSSNAMVALGLTYRAMNSKFSDQRQEVLEKLALGANEKEASATIIRDSIKNGMAPTIDSAKTVGLVSLPGMMSGLIFAGVEPTEAIRYQLVVMFMLIGVTSISGIIASYLAYKNFYNEQKQLTR